MSLRDALSKIEAPDQGAAEQARARLNMLTKPLGSLGHLEEIVCRFAAIRHDGTAATGRSAMALFVADHGVADEGVSAYPKDVTVQMLRNISRGGAAICVLARHFAYELTTVDVGVEADTSDEKLPGILYRRIAPGTQNFLLGPAMTPSQADNALAVGIEVANAAASRGVTLIGIGDMGIGNSTSAAALLAALTGLPPDKIAGLGTGLDDAGWRRKVAVIEAGLSRHRGALNDGKSLLAAVGGFEIAAMAGVCLGAAAARVPMVVDGFIATAAAAVAEKLHPGISEHLFFAHRSAEGGHRLALEHLRARPILDLDMRLGEGTGAALAMATIQAALALFHEMATFAGAGVAERIR